MLDVWVVQPIVMLRLFMQVRAAEVHAGITLDRDK